MVPKCSAGGFKLYNYFVASSFSMDEKPETQDFSGLFTLDDHLSG